MFICYVVISHVILDTTQSQLELQMSFGDTLEHIEYIFIFVHFTVGPN